MIIAGSPSAAPKGFGECRPIAQGLASESIPPLTQHVDHRTQVRCHGCRCTNLVAFDDGVNDGSVLFQRHLSAPGHERKSVLVLNCTIP
jgi:hypothetical protein